MTFRNMDPHFNEPEFMTLAMVKNDWKKFRFDDPEITPSDFPEYLHDVIDSALRGRNDLKVMYLTEKECYRLMTKIAKKYWNWEE